MAAQHYRPCARSSRLVVEPIGPEMVVYDTLNGRAHSLSAAALRVWLACDGTRELPALALKCELDTDTVVVALEQLRGVDLLQKPASELEAPEIPALSRRSILRRAATAGAGLGIAFPVIRSITAPSLAMAASMKRAKNGAHCFAGNSSTSCSTGSTCSYHSGVGQCVRSIGESCFFSAGGGSQCRGNVTAGSPVPCPANGTCPA